VKKARRRIEASPFLEVIKIGGGRRDRWRPNRFGRLKGDLNPILPKDGSSAMDYALSLSEERVLGKRISTPEYSRERLPQSLACLKAPGGGDL